MIALLVPALVSLFITSCKDDDAPGVRNVFTYDGDEFALTNAFADYDGSYYDGDNTYYFWEVYLTSEGITYDGGFEGTGDGVTIYIYSLNNGAELPAGTFEYYTESGSGIENASIYIDYNMDESTGTEIDNIDDASVTISKSGNTYTFNFTITLDDDEVITGSFRGTVTEI